MQGYEGWSEAPGGGPLLQHCETKGEVVGGTLSLTILPCLPWGDGPADWPGGRWVGDRGVTLPCAVQEFSQKLPSGFRP